MPKQQQQQQPKMQRNLEEKMTAVEYYGLSSLLLMQRCFSDWQLVWQHKLLMLKVAESHHNVRLLETSFKQWKRVMRRSKTNAKLEKEREMERVRMEKCERADLFRNKRLMRTAFVVWRNRATHARLRQERAIALVDEEHQSTDEWGNDSLNKGKDLKLDLQNFVIREQRTRLRIQRKELDQLRLLKEQLETGRAVTNRWLYQSILMTKSGSNNNSNRVLIRARDVWDLQNNGDPRTLLSFRNSNEQQQQKDKIVNIVVQQQQIPEVRDESENVLLMVKMRQKERERRLDEIRHFHKLKAEERRKHLLEEKAKLERSELEDRLRDKEEMKARRKRQKERELDRAQQTERQMVLCQMAHHFHRKWLLMHRGLHPWLKLMADSRLANFLAEKKRDELLSKRCLREWIRVWRSEKAERCQLAVKRMAEDRLKRKYTKRWIQAWRRSSEERQAAADAAKNSMVITVIIKWREIVRERKREKAANDFYETSLKRTCFLRWRLMVEFAFHDAKVKMRLERRVLLLLPDYNCKLLSIKEDIRSSSPNSDDSFISED